ncbi:GroES-like protein [Cerioporus squamosus]|nr:GroES-like protein [Cerioporus squamosus]
MASRIPTTMKAMVYDESGQALVKEHPVPVIGDDEILVKTVAVSLNPGDCKLIDLKLCTPGSIIGGDFSGIVLKTGKNVTVGPKVGDHVAGVVHACAFPDKGAYAEYVKADPELVWVVPKDTFSHEQAAAYGIAYNLGLVEPPEKVAKPEWVLVYGGSAACGLSAIQLAHLSGYKVITAASPRNHELLKSLGADVTIDYREPDLVSKIKQATGDSIKYGADMIGEEDTKNFTVQAIAPSGGKAVGLNPIQSEESGRKDVTFRSIFLLTVNGYPLSLGPMEIPAVPEDRAHMVAFLKKLPQLVRDGSLKPLPTKLFEGGLEGIKNGLQYMREGRVSAEKIVYRV